MSDEDQLSDAERELETALRSLRPTPARIDPKAAVREAGRRAATVRPRFWQVAAAAAVIAAVGGAWLTFGQRGELPDRVERESPKVSVELAAAIDRSAAPPTMSAYRQALSRSPAELEALLDQQATSESARNQFSSVGMLTVWNANLRSLPGEM
jgi:hypothetical protein